MEPLALVVRRKAWTANFETSDRCFCHLPLPVGQLIVQLLWLELYSQRRNWVRKLFDYMLSPRNLFNLYSVIVSSLLNPLLQKLDSTHPIIFNIRFPAPTRTLPDRLANTSKAQRIPLTNLFRTPVRL